MRGVYLLVGMLLALTGARAADIDVHRLDNGSALIVITGDFELGDVDTFRSKAEALSATNVTVAFRSEGGRLVAGLRIGALIREKKYTTVVPDGATCASTCALAWLGGKRRLLGQDARVGFHAAYVVKSSGPTESGPGNAVLGAYLNQLGLPEKAVLYITQTSPSFIQWMSLEDAAEHGIAVAVLPPLHSTAGYSLSSVETQADGAERRATDFVRALIAQWSRPRGEALRFLEGVYAENVVYQGKSTPRPTVLSNKQRLAGRWTERSYAIRPGSLSATCSKAGESCRVKGVMRWNHHDAKTERRSRGTASFEYSLVLAGATPQVVAETTTVQDQPSTAPGPLKKIQQDFQQLLARVSKMVQ
jgi:hypothetical protein